MARADVNAPVADMEEPAAVRGPGGRRHPDGAPAGKLAAQIARRIEDDIIRLGWPVGRNLGSEAELRERYQVSRSVLREAVRLVEHHRVARMRRGPGGGLLVTAPDAGPAGHAMVIYLDYVGTSVDDLMDARLLLEPPAAALAAERLTEDGIERLRRVLREEEERPEEPGAWPRDRLHTLLGELSGNPALHLFIDVLTRLTARYAHHSRRISNAEAARAKAGSRHEHARLVDAVVSGDAGLAQAHLTEHLHQIADWLHRHRAPEGAPAVPAEPRPPGGPGAKLAEVIAARIHDQIAAAGWPVGQVLGSETDLLVRYGISRAVLREAVRLLEHHRVARMRRGPGGGLVVTVPEPDAGIDTMALYLDYQGVTGEDLRVVRDAIELGTLRRVTARHRDPQVAERLHAALERTAEWLGPGRAGADLFHTELAELSGNPVLVMFLRTLTELWARHTAAQEQPPPGLEAAAEVERVHRRILEAILDGDQSMAQYRMRRHLKALTAWYH
ncbi:MULTISPECIES: FadR/GntR family transcriptional regulator [Thermomonospora]|uniref:GntR domain protein n=1 Tax=Thermomonospora curvata (strain ATCC 19995 / DSM 43183 / JCM 3096 / KCTC 9072 / NBRC 15933 / NCIMB 10081 / Henssen B9) TaxID=471852 RepID=D1A4X8_THECD|nr:MULTISPECIES: FCD domain-containing protein [Thermomonospora]ACY98147.1 GntR domain protein [Thermomonospora curvata DSM 43183]PKK13917.1 MAG: FadR family transcriptional regulator [Thermomonospora sp. CIF 1]